MNKDKIKAKLTKCQQSKCGFLQFGQGCKKCAECGAEPYLVNDMCVRCWNCEHDEGILRWDDDYVDNSEKEKEIKKKVELLRNTLKVKAS